MDTCCRGSSNVLGPIESARAGGSRGTKDVGAICNGAVTGRAMDGAI